MEELLITGAEAAEFEEFKRCKREAQIALAMARVLLDLTGKGARISHAAERAKRGKMAGLLVVPAMLDAVHEKRAGLRLICRIGGVGDSVASVKRAEAKRAVRQGADGLLLVPYFPMLADGNVNALRREFRRVRTGVKRTQLYIALDDAALSEQCVRMGVRAARMAGADGVWVRAELALVRAAQEEGGERLGVAVSSPSCGAQLRLLLDAGVQTASHTDGERLAEELSVLLGEGGRERADLPAQNMAHPAEGS